MRRIAVLVATSLLAAGCASLPRGSRADRDQLWSQAHDAFARDSLRVAAAAFQRLASEHPRSYQGHEARFYLGVLALEPRSGLDLGTARQQLSVYLSEDSAGGVRGYHTREARTLLRLAADLGSPCADRVILRCEGPPATGVVRAPEGGAPAEPAATPAATAEAARLRRELAERDATIRQLREELERIRNTLAPRRTPR